MPGLPLMEQRCAAQIFRIHGYVTFHIDASMRLSCPIAEILSAEREPGSTLYFSLQLMWVHAGQKSRSRIWDDLLLACQHAAYVRLYGFLEYRCHIERM